MWQSILSLFWRQTPKTLQRACVIRRSLLPGELGSGVSRGGPPLIFRRNGPKIYFFKPPPSPPLSQVLDDRAPLILGSGWPGPPYLKVRIRRCLKSPVSVTERKNHHYHACLFIIAREKDIHYACASSTKLRDEVLRLQNQILGRFRHAVRVIKKLFKT